MRAIPIKYVSEHSILGENLYTSKGQILVKENTRLNSDLLKKIELNKIYTLYIKDVHSDFKVNRLLEQSFRVKGTMIIKDLFEMANSEKSILNIHDTLSSYADDVLYDLKSQKHLTIEYIDVKNVDVYLYSSSLNVALLSTLIAWDLQYNDKMVKQIFLGAIYHDIGLSMIPNYVINKSKTLSTF